MRLSSIVSRLQTECPALRQVLLALSGAAPQSYPSAYVLPLSDAAAPGRLLGVHSQLVTSRFGVEIMVKHAAMAASGGPAQEALEDLREAVMAALAGWQPGPEFEPLAYAGGRLVQFDAGLAVWREEFTTRYEERIDA